MTIPTSVYPCYNTSKGIKKLEQNKYKYPNGCQMEELARSRKLIWLRILV